MPKNTHGRRRAALALAAATVVGGSAFAAPADAAISAPDDVFAVGLARSGDGFDAVQVSFPDGHTERITPEALGLGKSPVPTGFGSTIVAGDLNGDSLTDLVIGAPGLSLGKASDTSTDTWITPPGTTAAPGRSGRVHVLLHAATIAGGYPAANSYIAPIPARKGDLAGFALALSPRTGGGYDLYVGAPGISAANKPLSGTVYRLSLDAAGQATLRDTITQETPGVPGVSQQEDQFGAILAPARDGVLAGMPTQKVGKLRDAGAVVRLRTDATGALDGGSLITQDSKGVPGVAEAGDAFGAAIAADGFAIGSPGEDVGKAKDAGAVNLFTPSGQTLVPGAALTRNSTGIPGVAKTLDGFGGSLAAGQFACAGVDSVAIGASEHKGKAEPGSVTVLSPGKTTSCPTKLLQQGRGLPGTAEAEDTLGYDLAVVGGDQLAIAVPGEVQTGADGLVLLWSRGQSGTLKQVGKGTGFGLAISQAAG